MSVQGMRARNHPAQVQRDGPNDEVDDRAVPLDVFAVWHARWRFTLDAAASSLNHRCPRYFTREQNGLVQPWAGETVWCNPPYSAIRPWVEKAWLEYPRTGGVVLLVPANRAEQPWWQQLVEPYRDRPGSPLTVEFLAGRLRFVVPSQQRAGVVRRRDAPPFGCCLLIWHAPHSPCEQLVLGSNGTRQ